MDKFWYHDLSFDDFIIIMIDCHMHFSQWESSYRWLYQLLQLSLAAFIIIVFVLVAVVVVVLGHGIQVWNCWGVSSHGVTIDWTKAYEDGTLIFSFLSLFDSLRDESLMQLFTGDVEVDDMLNR